MKPPSYIDAAALRHVPATYAWDDYDPYTVIAPPPEGLDTLLAKTNYWAQVGFANACAEWVLHRLLGLEPDPAPLQYVESQWALLIAFRLSGPGSAVDSTWLTPVRGMIQLALVTVDNCLMHDGDYEQQGQAAFAAAVARHVQPDPSAFDAWVMPVAERLGSIYPAGTKRVLVVREAYDPAIDVVGHEKEYAEKFYASLERTENPFIRSRDRWAPLDEILAAEAEEEDEEGDDDA